MSVVVYRIKYEFAGAADFAAMVMTLGNRLEDKEMCFYISEDVVQGILESLTIEEIFETYRKNYEFLTGTTPEISLEEFKKKVETFVNSKGIMGFDYQIV